MNQRKHILTGIIAAVAMLVLILDGKTSIQGAIEGIELCLYTVIPSLFPFIFLSALMNSSLNITKTSIFLPLGRLCKLPAGSESILILGLLGGYPVGAEIIRQAYDRGQIDKEDGLRMLAFCSNAGPAFIFGMTSQLFSSKLIPWLIWGIQILSAIIVGILVPRYSKSKSNFVQAPPLPISHALTRSIRVTATICGWVILFRIILLFSNRWFLWLLPSLPQKIIAGILEIVNGCTGLKDISSEGLRFILCCAFLTFGGLCVTMQTATITGELGCKSYLKGKLLQSSISILFAFLIQSLAFTNEHRIHIPFGFVFCCVLLSLCSISIIYWKKLWISEYK